MSRGIIQSAIENKSVIMGVELREFSERGLRFESEQPTLADLVVPGTGRSISAELECLRHLSIASGER